MKTLTLLRHAKSERESPSGEDFDRPLNERGRRDSARMGEEIRCLGLRFDLVLASPARRAVETVEEVGQLDPRFDHRIYEATADQLLDIVRSADDDVESLLLVGHNPGFERLAARFTGNQIDDLPTAAVVELELPIEQWREAGGEAGRLVRFIRPKELA